MQRDHAIQRVANRVMRKEKLRDHVQACDAEPRQPRPRQKQRESFRPGKAKRGVGEIRGQPVVDLCLGGYTQMRANRIIFLLVYLPQRK